MQSCYFPINKRLQVTGYSTALQRTRVDLVLGSTPGSLGFSSSIKTQIDIKKSIKLYFSLYNVSIESLGATSLLS